MEKEERKKKEEAAVYRSSWQAARGEWQMFEIVAVMRSCTSCYCSF